MVRKTIEKTKSVARKRITGDPNYRIRDFLKVPKTIKTVDKVAFFSGVFGLLTTEAVAVKYPEKFWVFYCYAMPILLLTRMVYYVQLKWQYFMMDFCYFSHAATMYFHLYDYQERKCEISNYFYVFEWTDIDCDSDLEKFARVSLVG